METGKPTKGETKMEATNKPQSIAARNYIEALHAHRRGEITTEQLKACGNTLDAVIAKHGKP
jgi:hypothetical protein